jgi:hypothetical protein
MNKFFKSLSAVSVFFLSFSFSLLHAASFNSNNILSTSQTEGGIVSQSLIAYGNTTPTTGPDIDIDEDNPDLLEVVDVLENALIIAIGVVGVVFVAMIGYGAIKANMAAGDPRGLQGGKQTWTNAIIGFGIVVAVYVVINIAVSLLGGERFSMTAVFDMLREGISDLLDASGISNTSGEGF